MNMPYLTVLRREQRIFVAQLILIVACLVLIAWNCAR